MNKRFMGFLLIGMSLNIGTANGRSTAVDSSSHKDYHLELEGYFDVNYNYDFNVPKDRIHLYSSNPIYANQFNLAYGYLQSSFSKDNTKATIAIHQGGIVDLMYAGEKDWVKSVRELSLSQIFSKKLRVEVGILPSIFGFETFVNKDNLHASRAVFTDFAPDFEIGVRSHVKYSERLRGIYQITNGWQIIKENNATPAFGMAHIYEKGKSFLFNWGVFAGNEPYQGKLDQFRLCNNVFAKWVHGKFTIAPMYDWGFQVDSLNHLKHWHSQGMSVRLQLPKKMGLAMRYEEMKDRHSIIPETNTHLPNGFHMKGYTLTLEYVPSINTTFRLEAKYMTDEDAIFSKREGWSKSDCFVMASIASKINWKSFLE